MFYRRILLSLIPGLTRKADLTWLDSTEQTVQRMFEARDGKPISADAVDLIRSIREERADRLTSRIH